MAQTIFPEFGEERQEPLERRDEKSLKGGRSVRFLTKRGRNCEKRDRRRSGGGVSEGEHALRRGRRMLSAILIASAPTEPWQIAEYFSAFLAKTSKLYMSHHFYSSLSSFRYETRLDFGGCVWGAFASNYS